ncbi:hypothetical protein [Acetobacter sp. DsW_059]|nr:hypothetical protein [Acetobacter sp. DsW_059]
MTITLEKTSAGRPRSWTRNEDIALAWSIYRNQSMAGVLREIGRSATR